VFVAVNSQVAGLVAAADPIKDSTPEAIRQLHDAGIRVVMATGDGLTTAKAVAGQLGIDEVHGEVRPQDKVELVAALQSKGHRVAMAGDGINDAPALARAHVGIAMGTGTDVAMNSGHVTLVKGDLRGIARARQLSEATVANMKQNSRLCPDLQRAGSSDRGGGAVPGVRRSAVAPVRRGSDEPEFSVSCRQRLAAPQVLNLICAGRRR
jgi:P-type E1-E2 ATPase